VLAPCHPYSVAHCTPFIWLLSSYKCASSECIYYICNYGLSIDRFRSLLSSSHSFSLAGPTFLIGLAYYPPSRSQQTFRSHQFLSFKELVLPSHRVVAGWMGGRGPSREGKAQGNHQALDLALRALLTLALLALVDLRALPDHHLRDLQLLDLRSHHFLIMIMMMAFGHILHIGQ